MLKTRSGDKDAFLLLSLMYDEKSWGAIAHHLDHIFPKSKINRRALMAMDIPSSRVDSILESCDSIGNLQLLASTDNLSKNNTEFEGWIEARDPAFLGKHMIPRNQELWDIRMLPEFVAAREALMRKRLATLDGDVLQSH